MVFCVAELLLYVYKGMLAKKKKTVQLCFKKNSQWSKPGRDETKCNNIA